MRRIIGILFVLMLAASVGATGGYGGLYVNNRVPGSDLLRESLVFAGLDAEQDRLVNEIQKKAADILKLIEQIEEKMR